MGRFITFTVAVLLGLESSQAITNATSETQVPAPTLQSDFVYNSNQLAMSWDHLSVSANASSCLVY
jgi:hypothetical protein